MRFTFFLFLSVSFLFGFNIDISNMSVANGKTVFVSFNKEKGVEYKEFVFDKKKYKIFQNPVQKKKLYALIPVSYYTKAKSKELELIYKTKKEEDSTFFIKVFPGKYAKESIQVAPSKVRPSKKDRIRITKEYNEAMRIYNHVTPKSYISSRFIVPIHSTITSDFGKARIYNGSLKGYHSGTDFRAKTGTPIQASNDGVVVLCKKRFYSGGTVVLDHGQGIYTCYFHMSKFNVKDGDFVHKGKVIGLSGQSGRVTGPHLHFAARVAGVQVDPLQLLSILNQNMFRK